MVNSNGNIIKTEQAKLSITNRGFNYGDAVFETIKVVQEKVLFLEDHYFRLMATMRILRLEIPMYFTLDFFKSEILQLIKINNLTKNAVRVKFFVNRKEGGLFMPKSNEIEYLIVTKELFSGDFYTLLDQEYRVDLFKDYYLSSSLISTLKTNNRIVNVVGSIYAAENNFDNCFILNSNKHIVEALNANVFLIRGNCIITPPLKDGCIKGVMRKQIIEIIKKTPEYTIEEKSISPFELIQADELFLTNVISGIVTITQYRRKKFSNQIAKELLKSLNLRIS